MTYWISQVYDKRDLREKCGATVVDDQKVYHFGYLHRKEGGHLSDLCIKHNKAVVYAYGYNLGGNYGDTLAPVQFMKGLE